jgi:biopolymer transport protein ExbD
MGYKPKAGAVIVSPNVIPMADIMLVLLIIFMVVTPMVESPADMPNAKNDDAIEVAITRDGNIFLGSNLIMRDQITDKVRDLVANRLDKTVFLKCDARAKYGDVVAVVDEIRSAGVDNLGLLTDRAEDTKGKAPPPPTGQ